MDPIQSACHVPVYTNHPLMENRAPSAQSVLTWFLTRPRHVQPVLKVVFHVMQKHAWDVAKAMESRIKPAATAVSCRVSAVWRLSIRMDLSLAIHATTAVQCVEAIWSAQSATADTRMTPSRAAVCNVLFVVSLAMPATHVHSAYRTLGSTMYPTTAPSVRQVHTPTALCPASHAAFAPTTAVAKLAAVHAPPLATTLKSLLGLVIV